MVNANEPISYRIVRIVTRRLRKDTSMVRIAARIVRIVTRVVRVVTRMVKIPTRMIRIFTTRKPSLNKILQPSPNLPTSQTNLQLDLRLQCLLLGLQI